MKQISYLMLLSGLLAFVLVACSKDKISIDPELVVSTEKISFSNTGETKPFHVKSNVNWSVSSSESWLTLSPTNGGDGTNKIEATATENPNNDERQATITVTADGLSQQVLVVQSAAFLFAVDQSAYEMSNEEQEIVFTVQSNEGYTIAFDGEWMSRKSEPVQNGTSYQETITIQGNRSLFERNGTIALTQGSESLLVTVEQEANALTIAATTDGVASNAAALAAKLRTGWNLGNALEAAASPTSANETMWGNPRTEKALIDAVKAAGFNAVRIPCAWSGYIEDQETHRIKDSWFARVKEVVDYCVDNEMYAIINIHWDGGWLEEHPLYSHQEAVNAKQKALWEQIAVYFRDYDEYLLFAGTNEVHADYNAPSAENIEVQLSFNQTFVDAVRSTGGRNAYRNLIVQSYNTNIALAVQHLQMPNDAVNSRLMAEVHYYDPYDFCLDESSNKYLWGAEFAGSANVPNWGQEDWMEEQFAAMKTNFVDNGIPVILGEYGAILRSELGNDTALQNHKKARNNYLTHLNKTAKANGLIPFYWDNGGLGNNGFALFNRSNYTVVHQDAVDAIMAGIE